MNELDDIKVGDKVFRETSNGNMNIFTVSHVTNKQIVIKVKNAVGNLMEFRYWKKSGKLVGEDVWSHDEIRKLTPELRERFDFFSLQQKARNAIEDIVIPNTASELMAFIDAVKPFTKK